MFYYILLTKNNSNKMKLLFAPGSMENYLLNSLLITGPKSDLLTLLIFCTRSNRFLTILRGDDTWRTRDNSGFEMRRLIVIPGYFSVCSKQLFNVYVYFIFILAFYDKTRNTTFMFSISLLRIFLKDLWLN